MHLFAIVWAPEYGVRRFSISQGLQTQITKLFDQQAQEFLNGKEIVEFSAGRLLDDDELCSVKIHLPPELAHAKSSSLGQQVLDFTAAAIPQLVGLFVNSKIDGTDATLFQSFTGRQALTKDKLTMLSNIGTGFTKLDTAGLTLDSKLAAIHTSGSLLFKSFQVATRLIDMSAYYHAATDGELEVFKNNDVFLLEDADAFNNAAAIARVRKQVALILESGILKKVKPSTVASRAKAMGLDFVAVKKGKIVLPPDRQTLRKLLDFLQENYYEGCLTSQKFISNSKQVVN